MVLAYLFHEKFFSLGKQYIVQLNVTGCGGAHGSSAREDLVEVDEFSSPESRLQENCN